MKSLLDGSFVYTRAIETDIRKTFARVRAEQERAKAATQQKVAEIKPRVRGKA